MAHSPATVVCGRRLSADPTLADAESADSELEDLHTTPLVDGEG